MCAYLIIDIVSDQLSATMIIRLLLTLHTTASLILVKAVATVLLYTGT